jgi:predicted nucleic acid-binding protein
VFAVTESHRLSAYGAEFVALAEILGVPLVTEDRAILRSWPGRALSLDAAIEIH